MGVRAWDRRRCGVFARKTAPPPRAKLWTFCFGGGVRFRWVHDRNDFEDTLHKRTYEQACDQNALA